MDATNWWSMTAIFRQMDLWRVLVSYNEWKVSKFITSINFRRTDVMKTITLLAGPFNDSNINRIYHKTFKVKCPFTGNRRPVNFFYRHNSGPLPDDISSCPPCAYLNQDSTALAIITQKNILKELVHLLIWVAMMRKGDREGGREVTMDIQLCMCLHHQPPNRLPNHSTTVPSSSMEHNAHAK